MKLLLLLLLHLLLLLVPATAFAQQPTYDLTCEDVKKVLIVRMPDGLLDTQPARLFLFRLLPHTA